MSEVFGSYRGAVYDTADPANRGRLRIIVPQVLGDAPSAWAEPSLPVAPDYAPATGERVWVQFEGGDVNKPIYISADVVNAAKILAGSITTDLLNADSIIASSLFAQSLNGETVTGVNIYASTFTGGVFQTSSDPTVRRTIINDSGFHQVETDGTSIVDLPYEAGKPQFFKGQLEASGLLVTGSAEYRTTVLYAAGAQVTLGAGTLAPSSPPQYVIDWPSVTIDQTTDVTGPLGTFPCNPATLYGMGRESTYWVACEQTYAGFAPPGGGGPVISGTRFWKIFDDGTVALLSDKISSTTRWYGYVNIGGSKWGLVYKSSTATWAVANYDTEVLYSFTKYNSDTSVPAFGTDGVNVLIAEMSDTDHTARIKTFDIGIHVFSPLDTTSIATYPVGASLCGVDKHTYDIGTRYTLAMRNGEAPGDPMTSIGTTGTYNSDENFPAPTPLRGMSYNTTSSLFAAIGADGRLYTFPGEMWTGSTTSNWWSSHAWTGAGPVETPAGKYGNFTMSKRARLTLSVAALPGDATGVKFFLARKSTTPSNSDFHVQSGTAIGTSGMIITDADFSSAAPAGTGFPAGTAAWIRSSAIRASGLPMIDIEADGSGRFDAVVPVGCMMLWPGATAPAGWLLVLGQSLLRATYPDLATFCLAEGWGSADGTHFYLPDPRNRSIWGVGPSMALGANDGKIEANRGVAHTHNITNSDLGLVSNTAIAGAQNRLTGSGSGTHNHGGATGTSVSDPFGFIGFNLIIKY